MDPSPAPASGRIDGWREFQARFRALLSEVANAPGECCWADADFAHRPLGEREVTEQLGQWMRQHAGASVKVVAGQFEVLQRQHPRWLSWRQTWSHRVGCWLASDEIVADLRPMFIWRDPNAARMGLRMLDPVTAVGQWTTDPAVLALWQADFDAYLQRSSEGMPCTTLGL
jgi:hypothetical protein